MNATPTLEKTYPTIPAIATSYSFKSSDPLPLCGTLILNDEEYPVQVNYASVHSMWIPMDKTFIGADVQNLLIQIGDSMLEIGPCHADSASELGRGMIRLVPHKVIFDLKELFFNARVGTMDTKLFNLPPLLGNKNSITPAFRSFVSDLCYDLNTFMVLLDELDAQSVDEPNLVRDTIQANIIDEIGPRFRQYLDTASLKLNDLAEELKPNERDSCGQYFRRQIWNILLRSPFLSRSNLRPRGYHGDSEMMQMIYRNDYQGDSTFGQLLHKYSVDQPAAQAVRNRRGEIATLLKKRLDHEPASRLEKFRILSVACGPAFEIQDILYNLSTCAAVHISLLDQDPKALAEAAYMIGEVEEKFATTISADYLQQSVRDLKVSQQLHKQWGHFDFIYSMGLFDYLNADLAHTVVRCLFKLLNPGGELVIGNMAKPNPSRHFMEFWHDWKIILRSEAEMRAMTEGLPSAAIEIKYDQTGIQMMLHIKKTAEIVAPPESIAAQRNTPCRKAS